MKGGFCKNIPLDKFSASPLALAGGRSLISGLPPAEGSALSASAHRLRMVAPHEDAGLITKYNQPAGIMCNHQIVEYQGSFKIAFPPEHGLNTGAHALIA
jgi:hypothetical protein